MFPDSKSNVYLQSQTSTQRGRGALSGLPKCDKSMGLWDPRKHFWECCSQVLHHGYGFRLTGGGEARMKGDYWSQDMDPCPGQVSMPSAPRGSDQRLAIVESTFPTCQPPFSIGLWAPQIGHSLSHPIPRWQIPEIRGKRPH